MSRIAFLKHISLTGDIPRVRSAKKYNLKKTEFITYYQDYLKMNAPITFESINIKQQNHLLVLMLHLSGQTIFYDQCYRYKKSKNEMIHGIQRGEIPCFENVLLVGLRSEEFEQAFIKWGIPNPAYIELKQHYKSMLDAELRAIEECKKILDVSKTQNPFSVFLR